MRIHGCLAILLTACFGQAVHAQRVWVIPPTGAGYNYTVLAELPAVLRDAFQRELDCEPKVVWLFWGYSLGRVGFDFWRTDGQFVLMDVRTGNYFDPPLEELKTLLGPVISASLRVPWSYYVPPGIATVLVIVAIIAVFVWRHGRLERRLNQLKADSRFDDATQLYLNLMSPEEHHLTHSHEEAFEAAWQHALQAGISEKLLSRDFRAALKQQVKDFVNTLRDSAFGMRNEGHMEQACLQFTLAAHLLQP
jgi:hypothetical protein